MVCCIKYNFSDFMAAILNFMFYKKTPQGWELHIRPDITIGEPAKHNQNRKKLSAKTMLVTVSLRYPVVFAYICINIDFTIFFLKTNETIGFLVSKKHKNRHIIYVSSVCSCKIIRKYVYFYLRSWISPFWTFSRPVKKCNSFFSWSS